MIRSVHPFPARMAPNLAIAALKKLPENSVVLDPMVGSGTVIRQAIELGHRGMGFDLDPLAVLMSQVWTTPVEEGVVRSLCSEVLEEVNQIRVGDIFLSWIDEDPETKSFIDFWFANPQKRDLRKLAYSLFRLHRARSAQKIAAANLLRVAFSRLIITKDVGASLARDVSHSRPHKVSESTEFDVITSFQRSVSYILKILGESPPNNKARIRPGDARDLNVVRKNSVDLVLTSPPYLNAIDYMRGHRLALVWLGYSLAELREIRSSSIGAEKGIEPNAAKTVERIALAAGDLSQLPSRYTSMISRYAVDSYKLMSEISRVLRPDGRAVLVVGNSCLHGVFVNNSNIVARAASEAGLRLTTRLERDLPESKRYLPISSKRNPLGKRMRTETVLFFRAA